MKRRHFLAVVAATPAFGQVLPFRVFIQREERWQDVVGLSNCILGKLYVVKEFPIVSPPTEAPLGSTLELPWRNNINEISRIPAGLYKGKTRTDGSLGWRIELEPVPGRTFVQIHIGNFPQNTVGCILLGGKRSTTNACAVTGSTDALKELRARLGTASRAIEILIKDA